MKQVSEIIYSILANNTALMAKITKVCPLVASEKTKYPFVNYLLKENGYISKENVRKEYEIVIGCFAETYNESLEIADLVKLAFEQSEMYFKYNGSSPDYSEGIISTQSKFNFKK